MTRYELPFGLTHTVELLCIVCFMLDFVLRWRLSGMYVSDIRLSPFYIHLGRTMFTMSEVMISCHFG